MSYPLYSLWSSYYNLINGVEYTIYRCFLAIIEIDRLIELL